MLLKWRQRERDLGVVLTNMLHIGGEEVVKFLQDTLDCLFDILNANQQVYGEKIFEVLVSGGGGGREGEEGVKGEGGRKGREGGREEGEGGREEGRREGRGGRRKEGRKEGGGREGEREGKEGGRERLNTWYRKIFDFCW